MEELFADLHIHSCLSPCGDEEMTPGNILGMAVVKGLQAVAIADHNSARNLPAAQKIAEAYGILLIPAIEITTKEEVHMLGYFPDVDTAVAFGESLRPHLPKRKNKPSLFGEQLVMDEDDQVIDHEEALLIGATDLPLEECALMVRSVGGVPVPAHINRGSNGLLINLGLMPEEPSFSTVEVWRHLPCPLEPTEHRHVLHSSDAHYLGDIQEQEFLLKLPEKNVGAFLKWIDTPR
ncbi:MAG: PHP domain-containing protein [Clostridiales bacterium]|nr:PHP domain-containing protein [Clostridiales bacterium]